MDSRRSTPEGTAFGIAMDQSKEVIPGEVSDLPPFGVPWLLCSCCRTLIADTPADNACFGIQPYPHDTGFGECRKCYGNPAAEDIGERLGWAGRTFFDARIEIVRERLKPQSQQKFDKLRYEQKIAFISRLLERGLII